MVDARSRSRCLLIVEDHPAISAALAGLFGLLGVHVVARSTLAAGLDAIVDHPECRSYEAIVVDLRLPDGSGESLVESARRHNPAARVVVHTGDCGWEARDRLAAAGVVVLDKPTPFSALLSATFPDLALDPATTT